MSSIAGNVESVRARMNQATERAGRLPSEVTLVAVTKRQPAAAVLEVLAAGVSDLGENYVQEAAEKRGLIWPSQITAARWHLMGHLQSNKAKTAVSLFDLIQSVDSVKLARELGKQAVAAGKTPDVLLQVHLGDEATKSGVAPDQALDAAAEMAVIPGLRLTGLMGIAPNGQEARPYFQELHRLFERLPAPNRQTLSMGMTNDFETAIEEGATMIRVGTAIFGPRV